MAKKGKFLLGLAIGSAAVYAAANLLDQKYTANLKQKVSAQSDRLKNRAIEFWNLADDFTADWRTEAKEKIEESAQKLQDLVPSQTSESKKDLQEHFKNATEQVKNQFDQAQAHVQDKLAAHDEQADFDDIVLDHTSAFQEAKKEAEVTNTVPKPEVLSETDTIPPVLGDPAPAPELHHPDTTPFDENKTQN